MRSVLVRLHRYMGLTIAGFLIVAGLTGAILSWDKELDEWINRDLYTVASSGPALSPFELAAIIEAREPRGRVTFMSLQREPGRNASFTVRPRIDPSTGEPFVLDYTHVFVDPATGAELGRRDGDGTSLSWRGLMPFLIKFHYSLHLPALWGDADWGIWLMGLIALVWFVNSLMAIILTLPPRRRARAGPPKRSWLQRWKPSWAVRWRGGAAALPFDLHRAGALWIWPVLLLVAFTGFTQNLYGEVFAPAISPLTERTPGPYDTRPLVADPSAEPTLGAAEIVERARAEAARLGWSEPADSLSFSPDYGLYAVRFQHIGDDLGGADISTNALFLDAADGQIISRSTALSGTAADVIEKMQFPLHSGRLLGLPGRILMSLFGLMVAMLSVTGILIWARKRRFAR